METGGDGMTTLDTCRKIVDEKNDRIKNLTQQLEKCKDLLETIKQLSTDKLMREMAIALLKELEGPRNES